METLFNTPAEIDSNGNIKFDMQSLKNAAKELRKPETRNVRIILIQDFKDATKKQIAYYHGFLIKDVVSAFESLGDNMTEVEADKSMRELFLFNYETNLSSGRKRKIIRLLDKSSMSFPNTKEMSVYFESIVRYCAENMNYIINLPEDFKNIDLNFERI